MNRVFGLQSLLPRSIRCTKSRVEWSLTPDPIWRAYSTHPDPLLDFWGLLYWEGMKGGKKGVGKKGKELEWVGPSQCLWEVDLYLYLSFPVHIVLPLPDALHLARLMCCLFVKDFAMGGQLDGLLPFLVAVLQFYSWLIYRVVQKKEATLHFPKYLENYWR